MPQAAATAHLLGTSTRMHGRRYGHLTWEWGAGIRSYVHPLLFAAPLQVSA